MNRKCNKKNFIILVGYLVFIMFFFNPIFSEASENNGTIDGIYKYAKGVDDSTIKINFGLFRGSIDVKITDSYLTGFAWGEKIGWINLSPLNGGIINNGEGILSGYATTEFGGLINFKPAGGGVIINSNGEFKGYALSEKFGKISFNCLNDNSCALDNYKVKTDWRPKSNRENKGPVSSQAVIVSSNESTTDTPKTVVDTTNSKPSPLPVVDIGQYSGSGDVIKENKVTEKGELVTTIRIIDNSKSQNDLLPKETDVNNNTITETNINNLQENNKNEEKVKNIVQVTANQIKQEASVIIETPAINISTKTVATIGIAGGSTAIISSLTSGLLSASEFFLVFFRFWSLILATLGIKKRREPWGTVYDSITKQPLDPAYVILQNKQGKEIATSITDLDGRYGFLVPPGTYTMVAKKTNYIAPSIHLHGQNRDELYDNLYFGEEIKLESGKTITKDIPMDPQGFDWNEFAKKDKNLMKFHSSDKKTISKISNILFWIGLIFSLLFLFIKPDIYNIAIIFLYIFLCIFRFIKIKTKSFGLIIDKKTNFPLSFAIIRIYSVGSGKEIFHRVADQYGHYYCLLPKGEYKITIEKKNDDESYSNVYTISNFISKKGILNTDFVI